MTHTEVYSLMVFFLETSLNEYSLEKHSYSKEELKSTLEKVLTHEELSDLDLSIVKQCCLSCMINLNLSSEEQEFILNYIDLKKL